MYEIGKAQIYSAGPDIFWTILISWALRKTSPSLCCVSLFLLGKSSFFETEMGIKPPKIGVGAVSSTLGKILEKIYAEF